MEQPIIPKQHPRAQSSIRSFFQPRQPNYTLPPSSTNFNANTSDRISTAPTSAQQSSISPILQSEPEISPLKPRSGTASPPQASISPIREKHIQQLKRVNSLLLPINYPDSFYQKIVDPQNSPNFSRVILFHEPLTLKSVFSSSPEPKVVGGIVCRLEKYENTKTSSIYIQSLALLSPYRSHGIATRVLNNIIQEAMNTKQIGYPITSLYAHVWTENTEGLDWYTARGFTREEPLVKDYYRRLQPPNAWIMRRSLVTSDHLPHFLKPNGQVPPQTTTTTRPALLAANSNPSSGRSSINHSPRRAASYQNAGPGHEWNDLPDDILGGKSKPQTPEPSASAAPVKSLMPSTSQSAAGSAASSRSSSRSAAKKKRQYPVAAFDIAGKDKEGS